MQLLEMCLVDSSDYLLLLLLYLTDVGRLVSLKYSGLRIAYLPLIAVGSLEDNSQ
jgi:hypothetical protein